MNVVPKYLLFLLLVFSMPALSRVVCEGKVERWLIMKDGYLNLDATWNGTGHSQRICNVSGTWDSIAADTCREMKDIIALAFTLDREFKVTYYTSTSCLTEDLLSGGDTKEGPGNIGF